MRKTAKPSPLAGEGRDEQSESGVRGRKPSPLAGEPSEAPSKVEGGRPDVASAKSGGVRGPISSKRRTRGFTLVEVIVVIAIIGTLATVVIVRYAGKTDQARQAAAKAQINQIEGAVIEFQAHCSRLPRSLDELVNQPGDCPNWQGSYFRSKSVPKDPWGKEYVYRQEGADFEVICLGADGQEGGEGYNRDISSLNLDGAM